MKAAIYNGPHAIELGERPDPTIQEPSDAVVHVVLGCVCGSDLWYYRGDSPHAPGPIGHEFIDVIEEAGADAVRHGRRPGRCPVTFCDGTCANCTAGWPSNCLHGGSFGNHGVDGGQGEAVRAPFADATLVKVLGSGYSDETMLSSSRCQTSCVPGTMPPSAPESNEAMSSPWSATERSAVRSDCGQATWR